MPNPSELERVEQEQFEELDAPVDDRAEIARLREALERCRDKFLDYHWQHFNKANANDIEPAERRERMRKSDANLTMANICRTALGERRG